MSANLVEMDQKNKLL